MTKVIKVFAATMFLLFFNNNAFAEVQDSCPTYSPGQDAVEWASSKFDYVYCSQQPSYSKSFNRAFDKERSQQALSTIAGTLRYAKGATAMDSAMKTWGYEYGLIASRVKFNDDVEAVAFNCLRHKLNEPRPNWMPYWCRRADQVVGTDASGEDILGNPILDTMEEVRSRLTDEELDYVSGDMFDENLSASVHQKMQVSHQHVLESYKPSNSLFASFTSNTR